MNEPSGRMTQGDKPPSDSELAEWIGGEAYGYWNDVTRLIEHNYPHVFAPEWLYGGQKHGWSLRYKKNKSFCTFVPEKNGFALLIVLGAEERAKVETIKEYLSIGIREAYDNATTYHDGKWLLLRVDSPLVVEDVRRLLEVKRKPRKRNAA
jgi:Protein of unknown function (DUF3788)